MDGNGDKGKGNNGGWGGLQKRRKQEEKMRKEQIGSREKSESPCGREERQ